MPNPQGYRSIIAFGLVTLFGLFGVDLAPEMIEQYTGAIITVIGLLGIVLRAITTGPMFKKTAPTAPAAGANDNAGPKQLMVLLLVGLMCNGLLACASRVDTQTPAQQVGAIQHDFQTAQRAILAYAKTPYADGSIVDWLYKAQAGAREAIAAAQEAVRKGDDPMTPGLIAAARSAVNLVFEYLAKAGLASQPPPRIHVAGYQPPLGGGITFPLELE